MTDSQRLENLLTVIYQDDEVELIHNADDIVWAAELLKQYLDKEAKSDEPKRNQTLTLEIGADGQNELIAALRHIEFLISTGSIHVVSGDYSWGGFFDLVIRPEQTHEKWEADLKTYMEASS